MTEVPILRPAILARFRSAIRLSVFQMAVFVPMAWAATAPSGSAPMWPLLMVFFVAPALQTAVDAFVARRAFLRRNEQDRAWPRDPAARFAFWVASRPSRATHSLVIAIVLVALCQLWRGPSSIVEAGLVKDAVRRGQVWRLLTAGVVHVNFWHLLGNMGALLALGRMVEVLAHWSRFAAVFLLSILCGSVFSLVLLPSTTSVGASGGLMGLLGFLIILGSRLAKGLPPRFVRSLIGGVLWVAASGAIAYAFLDNAAHLGGFLAGIGLGLAWVPRSGRIPIPPSRLTIRAGAAAMAVLILVVLGAIAILLRAGGSAT